SVQVNLSGPPSKIKQLQTTQDFTVELDLTNYELGEYEVDYDVEGLPENVTATALPKKTTVSIQNVVEQTFEVQAEVNERDRKSTRLNSSHVSISYAVFCLKKKKIT